MESSSALSRDGTEKARCVSEDKQDAPASGQVTVDRISTSSQSLGPKVRKPAWSTTGEGQTAARSSC